MKRVWILLLMSILVLAPIAGAAIAADGEYSVKSFGAVGDGVADDTAAFQSALDKAKAGPKGSFVQVPPGQYRLTKTIRVENALLKGSDAGGWPADSGPLPTILVDFTDGPCIVAGEAASIHGLDFEYDHKGQDARKFGPTISMTGNGISITNLRIHDPYEGIMTASDANVGRLNIENVFIVSARECGIYVTNTYDVATLRNIEVWNCRDIANMQEYCQEHCTAFKLGKNDEIRMSNCFAFKCHTAYEFFNDKQGATWGGMTGCSADLCVEGIVVDAAESLRVTGGCLWVHFTAMRLNGPARMVAVNGVDMKSNGDAALIVRGGTNATITGCSFTKSGPSWPKVPGVKLESGSSIILSNCIFGPDGPGIVIGKAMDGFSITGNVFQPSARKSITDNSAATARKVIANNLVNSEDKGSAKSK